MAETILQKNKIGALKGPDVKIDYKAALRKNRGINAKTETQRPTE